MTGSHSMSEAHPHSPAAWSGATLQPSPDLPPPCRVLIPRQGQQSQFLTNLPQSPKAPKPQRQCSPVALRGQAGPPGAQRHLVSVFPCRSWFLGEVGLCALVVVSDHHPQAHHFARDVLCGFFFFYIFLIYPTAREEEREVKA